MSSLPYLSTPLQPSLASQASGMTGSLAHGLSLFPSFNRHWTCLHLAHLLHPFKSLIFLSSSSSLARVRADPATQCLCLTPPWTQSRPSLLLWFHRALPHHRKLTFYSQNSPAPIPDQIADCQLLRARMVATSFLSLCDHPGAQHILVLSDERRSDRRH